MKTNLNLSTEKLAFMSGILMCAAYILYFLVMRVLDLVYMTELRVLNFVIQFTGIVLTIRYYKARTKAQIKYLEGFWLGSLSASIGIALFSLFIYFFFAMNVVVLHELKVDAPVLGDYLTPFSAAISVLAEGLIASLILSFAIMQYFKDDRMHSPFKKRGTFPETPEKETY